jgi:hypothetical protein
LKGVCHWQGGFEWFYKIGAGRVESREREKSLDIRNFRSLAIAMAEIVKMYKCVKIKGTIFRPLGLIVQLVLRPNGVAVINLRRGVGQVERGGREANGGWES